jgi:hypothetical protein
VESIFLPEEAQLIQAIPPSSKNQPNALIWRGSATGTFTDKEPTGFWKQLWALKVPNN